MRVYVVACLGVSFLSLPACDDSSSDTATTSAASASGAGGSSPFEDINCDNPFGCPEGQIDLEFQCGVGSPQGGDEEWVATLNAAFSADDGTASCVYDPTNHLLGVGLGGDSVGGVVAFTVEFDGGGSYQLGGPATMLEQLTLHAIGGPGDGGLTFAGTADPCGSGCRLEVTPDGSSPAAPGSWETFRFRVTCEDGVGYPHEAGCQRCTFAPSTFSFDAACFTKVPE